jgi:hypothetical protein
MVLLMYSSVSGESVRTQLGGKLSRMVLREISCWATKNFSTFGRLRERNEGLGLITSEVRS